MNTACAYVEILVTTVGWLSKLAGSHSTRVTDYNMQCHAVFKLEDMPGELMKVLIILKVYYLS